MAPKFTWSGRREWNPPHPAWKVVERQATNRLPPFLTRIIVKAETAVKERVLVDFLILVTPMVSYYH